MPARATKCGMKAGWISWRRRTLICGFVALCIGVAAFVRTSIDLDAVRGLAELERLGNPVYEPPSMGASASAHSSALVHTRVRLGVCNRVPHHMHGHGRYKCIREKEEAWILIVGDSNGRNLFEALVDSVFTFSGLVPAHLYHNS